MINNNIQFIKSEFKGLYNHYMNMISESDVKFEYLTTNEYANGKFIFEGKEIFLHSSYSPYYEAQKLAINFNTDSQNIIIFGGGFLYHLEYYLEKYPEKFFVIIEPNNMVFYNLINHVDIINLFKNSNFDYIISDDPQTLSITLAKFFVNRGLNQLDIWYLPSYLNIYHDFFTQFQLKLVSTLKSLRGNFGTEFLHAHKWIKNYIRNFNKMNTEALTIDFFKNFFIDKPALVISAGPSLEGVIDLVKENQGKFILIAAGSAINILESNGITPDFFVALDSEGIQEKIFKNIKSAEITLVYNNSLRYSALEMFKGKKVWFKGNHDLLVDFYSKESYLCNSIIEIGPSCANISMEIARFLGCTKICFVGQDLAYTRNMLYSPGSVHDIDIKTDIGDRIEVLDMHGNKVFSKTNFLIVKSFFESYIEVHSEIKYYNFTNEGLHIEGMKHISFREFLETEKLEILNVKEKINRVFDENCLGDGKLNQLKKYNQFFTEISEEVSETSNLSDERVNKIKKMLISFDSINNKNIEINQILKITSQIEDYKFFKHWIGPMGKAFEISVDQKVNKDSILIRDHEKKLKTILNGLLKKYLYYDDMIKLVLKELERFDV